LALSFFRSLGVADYSHDPDIQMALVEPFWMVSERKEKLGIGNFSPFFLPSTKKNLIVGWYYNV
jgi:hypothetical protein